MELKESVGFGETDARRNVMCASNETARDELMGCSPGLAEMIKSAWKI